jgi:acyl-CoA synthetase (AMP-forming)/AMP-acid ligase II
VGTTGEIVIRGANVMQGYGDNPQANYDAFVHGWFRTGDPGFLDPTVPVYHRPFERGHQPWRGKLLQEVDAVLCSIRQWRRQ